MKLKEKGPIDVRSGARGFLESIKNNRRLDHKELQTSIIQAGGPQMFLSASYPNLARLAQDGVSEEDLVRYTSVDLKDAERRLVACARCRLGRAACSEDRFGHKRGQVPRWQNGQLVFSGCSHWPEYQLRSRLIAAGVPERYAGCGIRQLEEWLNAASKHAVAEFFRDTIRGKGAAIVMSGSFATKLAVGALRAVAQRREDMSFRFVRARSAAKSLKSYFTDSKVHSNPLNGCDSVSLLAVCGLRPEVDGDWFTDTVQALISSRYDEEKPTLVTLSLLNEQLKGSELLEPVRAAGELYFGEEVPVCLSESPDK